MEVDEVLFGAKGNSDVRIRKGKGKFSIDAT